MSSYGEKLRRERREALAQRALPSEVFNEYGEVFAVTKTEAGASFPASDYAYVPDASMPSTWKLRLTASPGGAPDAHIVGAAIAALGKGFRGNKVQIPAADLAAVKAKVAAAWKKANPDKKPADMPSFALFATEEAVVACGDSPYAQADEPLDGDDDFLEAILEHHDDILDLLNDYNPTDSDVVDFAAKLDKAVRASSADIYGLLAKIVVADGESTQNQDQGNQDNQNGPQDQMAYSLIVSEDEFAGLPPALAAQLVKRLKASLAKTDDPAKKAKLEAEIKKYGG